MASVRVGACCATLGDRIYVIGGKDGDGTPTASAEVFDALSGRWAEMPSLGTPRDRATAITLGGHLYVCGGKDGNGAALTSVEAWDPALSAAEESNSRCRRVPQPRATAACHSRVPQPRAAATSHDPPAAGLWMPRRAAVASPPLCPRCYTTVTPPLHHRYTSVIARLLHRYFTVAPPLLHRYIPVTHMAGATGAPHLLCRRRASARALQSPAAGATSLAAMRAAYSRACTSSNRMRGGGSAGATDRTCSLRALVAVRRPSTARWAPRGLCAWLFLAMRRRRG